MIQSAFLTANRGLGKDAVSAVDRLAHSRLFFTNSDSNNSDVFLAVSAGIHRRASLAASTRSRSAIQRLTLLLLPHRLAVAVMHVGDDVNPFRALPQLLAKHGKRPALSVLAAFLAVLIFFLHHRAAAATSTSDSLDATKSAQPALAIHAVALLGLPPLTGFPHRHQPTSNALAILASG